MGFFDGYNIATSGMSAQRTRINVVSANIANAQTTHGVDGGPYKKQNVVFEEILLDEINKGKNPTEVSKQTADEILLRGVGVSSVEEVKGEPMMKYDPTHPDANKDGYVAFPNINPVIEMVDLMEAMKSYEANVSAFSTHKNIDSKTIDILRA